ncbi:hypothetical protein AtNW77_Chr3g0164511 [Arabidopsis thaliana]|uniref:Transmembrane protein n=4 Tax=Arabidopsis TaxID=3701 RepID=A0A384KB16_ARATH|nr:uncharacterized protein AT3G09280 [Arabidopsis thaliana]KAG7624565.1 hypothetical protein ISN45_At03g008870 [Arabidopsis thaliana x Arabidopsis arenosa]KAG7630581.1 hypothetical protein ISN44_As03g008960 [Arabidopsis suecica]AAF14026.1 hypothetical protein [Arabidopsis thaliana]AAX23841.1 hypothetical protein At3g09280 [Arabidopsis thaliana]AEE74746.1 transmembrane protein [Arabidopsis thaliana]|eukprot:NP_187539.1 transmembrane protein [Arabidopsis thaliana]
MDAKHIVLCFLLTYVFSMAAASSEAEPPATRKLGRHEWPGEEAEAPEVSHLEETVRRGHHHSTVERSVAGGGVILGGLATTFLVVVFCYIRATRKHKPNYDEKETETPKVLV